MNNGWRLCQHTVAGASENLPLGSFNNAVHASAVRGQCRKRPFLIVVHEPGYPRYSRRVWQRAFVLVVGLPSR